MKRSIIIGAVLLVIGIVVGWLCRQSFIRPETITQMDTLVRVDTVTYSRLELEANRICLEIPDIRMRRYVFIETERLDTVYRDNIQYVKMPREYYYTRVKDAEVWHSGVDSTIDSLNVFARTTSITETSIKEPKRWQFSLDLGVDVGRACNPYFAPNLGAEISLDRWSLNGAIGCNLDVVENNLLEPSLYYEIGLRYSLIKR